MQPSDQQPPSMDENEQRSIQEQENLGNLPEESSPLYEFPPESELSPEFISSNVSPESAPKTGSTAGTTPGVQAGPEGFVYPPLPSYYQNMPHPGDVPPLPSIPTPAQGSAKLPPYQSMPPQFQPPSVATMYPATGVPPFQSPNVPPPAPTQKRSHKWIWILVSVAAVILLAGCGLCGWGFYSIFRPAFQGVSGSLNVVNDYYSNLQSQNYVAAYADLSVHNLTEARFAQQARQLDQQDGPILSYTPNQPSFSSNPNSGPNLSQFNIVVNIKRQKLSYTVFLTLNQINGKWKITYYDRL
jgi:hypothetical protein